MIVWVTGSIIIEWERNICKDFIVVIHCKWLRLWIQKYCTYLPRFYGVCFLIQYCPCYVCQQFTWNLPELTRRLQMKFRSSKCINVMTILLLWKGMLVSSICNFLGYGSRVLLWNNEIFQNISLPCQHCLRRPIFHCNSSRPHLYYQGSDCYHHWDTAESDCDTACWNVEMTHNQIQECSKEYLCHLTLNDKKCDGQIDRQQKSDLYLSACLCGWHKNKQTSPTNKLTWELRKCIF